MDAIIVIPPLLFLLQATQIKIDFSTISSGKTGDGG